MKKKSSILYKIRQREYFVKCNLRANAMILREIVCQKSTKFDKIWEKHSNHPINYELGKIYFDNYRTCFTINGMKGLPQQIYKLPQCPKSQKIEDTLICECPLSSLPLENQGYRSSFLALTAHNWLMRYDLHSGRLLEEVYLSPKYKFRHLTWDRDGYTLTVRSTHSKMSALHRQTGLVQTLLMAITVFTIFPFQFEGMMEIDKKVFGHDITDAMVAQGAVIIMHQGGVIKIYSWQHVIKMGKQYDVRLGDLGEMGRVGSQPTGVPCNIRLEECPPVLFEVKCAEHNLVLGGVPWHYIITPHSYRGCFHVYSVKDKQLAENGMLDFGTLNVEPDKCQFHADDSGRIIHTGSNEIRVLKLSPSVEESGKYTINLEFCIKSEDLRKKTPTKSGNEVMVTSSGRISKRTKYYADSITDADFQTIQTVDYENELDLLTLTAVHQDSEGMKGTVYLHNNSNGQVIKVISLPETWREFCDHAVQVDLDTVVHIVKAPARKFSCYVHRINRCLDEENDGHDKKRKRMRHSILMEEDSDTS